MQLHILHVWIATKIFCWPVKQVKQKCPLCSGLIFVPLNVLFNHENEHQQLIKDQSVLQFARKWHWTRRNKIWASEFYYIATGCEFVNRAREQQMVKEIGGDLDCLTVFHATTLETWICRGYYLNSWNVFAAALSDIARNVLIFQKINYPVRYERKKTMYFSRSFERLVVNDEIQIGGRKYERWK